MKRSICFAATAILTLALPLAAQSPATPTVTVGSDAPPLKVMKWFKGSPVPELKEGQVYVLEFWATWCVPCIAAMPHVTEMAKKFEGKTTIIGVSVWERPADKTDAGIEALVAPFVEKQGDRMVYHVAAEGPDGFMADHWLKAAGQDSIPCTMIIGKDRKIAWIGHPKDMDKPLEEIVAGTFDIKVEADRQKAAQAKQAEKAALIKPITDALAAKDPKAVVAAVDNLLPQSPEMEPVLFPVKFEALIQTDEAAAFAYLKDWFTSGKIEKDPVNGYNAYIGLTRHLAAVSKPDWSLVAQVLEKTNTLRGNKDPQILAAAADAFFNNGDKPKAIDYQQKALDLAAGDANLPAAWSDNQKEKLQQYKHAK